MFQKDKSPSPPRQGSMAAGRYDNWNSKLGVQSSHLKPQMGSRESELEMVKAFKLEKSVPSDVLPPTRLHLLSLPQTVPIIVGQVFKSQRS